MNITLKKKIKKKILTTVKQEGLPSKRNHNINNNSKLIVLEQLYV